MIKYDRKDLKRIAESLYLDVRWYHSNKKINDMILNKLYREFRR